MELLSPRGPENFMTKSWAPHCCQRQRCDPHNLVINVCEETYAFILEISNDICDRIPPRDYYCCFQLRTSICFAYATTD